MKYNLGCGADYRFGWINVDRQAAVAPDLVWDLLSFPWPFADESAEEIALIHVLDEVQASPDVTTRFMQELYRICQPGATVSIRNTDPRHADAAMVSGGAGGLTMAAFQSYDLLTNEDWIAKGLRHTPSAVYARVDFPTVGATRYLDARWQERWQSGSMGPEALTTAVLAENNVVASSDIVLRARKPFVPGRSLAQCDALVLVRFGGLGDLLMALSACKAIKSLVGRPVYLLTAPAYRPFAELCPHVDAVFTDEASLTDHLRAAGQTAHRIVDLSHVRFGLSRLHEVDAFLQALSIVPSDASKGLDIDLSKAAIDPSVATRLATVPPGCRRIILHPGISDPNRTWPETFWRDLAQHCIDQGHAVIIVGRSHSQDGKGVAKLDDGRTVDFSDGLDLASSLEVMRRCDLMISADSGPVQLAGASDIAIIGLYSVVGGDKRLPYRNGSIHHKTLALGPDCPFSPCYRWMSDPGTQSEFSRATGVQANDLNALFSRWCVNPAAYSCVREAGMLDKVKAAIPAMLDPGPPDSENGTDVGRSEQLDRSAMRLPLPADGLAP